MMYIFVAGFILLSVGFALEHIEGDQYIYYGGKDPSEIAPVIEYVAPPPQQGRPDGEDPRWSPDFLASTSTSNGPRLVEFYAPWCPHCQHFKSHYIELGRKINDLAKQIGAPEVKIYAVSCTANKPICLRQGIHGYPVLKVFKAGSINGTVIDRSGLHPFGVLQALDIDMSYVDPDLVEKNKKRVFSKKAIKKQVVTPKRTQEELYADALLSFDFTLRNGIFMDTGKLDGNRTDALYDWVYVLGKSLPPQMKLQELLDELEDDIEMISKDEKNLIAVVEKHQPGVKSWSMTCTHGDKFAGYTCGLWELFHISAVGMTEWNSNAIQEDDRVSTMHAADCLHDVVKLFFGCEVCRKNFLQMYDDCAFDRCNRLTQEFGSLADWKQLALWLWETHNDVNVRLMKERAVKEKRITTSEDEINARWPSRSDCLVCWRDDGSWDEDHIYSFLRLEYWPNDITNAVARKKMMNSVPLNGEDDLEGRDGSRVVWLYCGIPVLALIFFVHRTVSIKMDKRRSGRHKKIEDDYYGNDSASWRMVDGMADRF
eukprot:CAMPEP_0198299866 /NCGR_PEP_ID=MMETSP1449-20131203/46088_1 /TAXON_ID=420275 /ORGANISM="Attheya septentrionalis, Strain CCMP2084" /LENGTH=540 /DNA_ID=CAMNT_0044001525 /DNA_START=268 /DNA_END=1890 /DNA_ORIENTATION=+